MTLGDGLNRRRLLTLQCNQPDLHAPCTGPLPPHHWVAFFRAFATYGRAASIQRGQRAFIARSINHPAGATRSINEGPPFFSIGSTAITYQNLGNTGISVYASGQALAKAFASSVAWGDEEPIANPALAMLSPMIGVQLAQRTAWLRLSASASLKPPSIFSFA